MLENKFKKIALTERELIDNYFKFDSEFLTLTKQIIQAISFLAFKFTQKIKSKK